MPIVAKIDELGRPAWIALVVFAFFVFFPLGFAILAFALWSGRMGCGHYSSYDRWQHKMERLQSKMDHVRGLMNSAGKWTGGPWGSSSSSGNHAFDEYRDETLKRLEQEQREFREFLDRLRFAKDKTEFDQFMNERRNRPEAPQSPA